jgi:ATP-binding protein involved in chromosome partitioning
MEAMHSQVMQALRRIKGPDLDGNIVDLGLVSDVLIKDGRAYFSITVPASRASELEPLRKAAETVVAEVAGITSVTAVLTAQVAARSGGAGPESTRVQQARAKGMAGDGGKAAPASPPAVASKRAGSRRPPLDCGRLGQRWRG